MRRAIKLVFHEHRINCPYCGTALIYHLRAAIIQLVERTCLKSGKEFAIENNIAKVFPRRNGHRSWKNYRKTGTRHIPKKPAGAAGVKSREQLLAGWGNSETRRGTKPRAAL